MIGVGTRRQRVVVRGRQERTVLTVGGIGDPLAPKRMPPQVRITPAGRFVSRLARDSHGKELLVLDYDASISLPRI